MGHRQTPTRPTVISFDVAEPVAATMHALAAPSRVRILIRLQRGPCAVTALAADIDMEQSAVSHQLRLLRNLGLVVRHRQGRSIHYALYDDHVSRLLDEAISHTEHVRLGLSNVAPNTPSDPT